MKIRRLTENDIPDYAQLYRGAYPIFTPDQAVNMLKDQLTATQSRNFVAVDENERLLGGFILHDFTIYQNYNELKMCGIGGVAVALDAKKQGVAKFMLQETLRIMEEEGYPVSILYPFRHDFYQNMGWGQVGEVKEFKFHPSSLPVYPERKQVRRYQPADVNGLKTCYDRFARPQNCMAKRSDASWERRLNMRPDLFVYEEDGEIQGYVAISFKKHDSSFLKNDIVVNEMVYLNRKAYFGLLGFLASQFDQISSIYLYTRRNDPFHHLLKEPRREDEIMNRLYHYSQRIGLAWMFRALDVEKTLMARVNYNAANLEVTFHIEDSFLPNNAGMYTLVLKDGKPEVCRERQSENQIKLDISTFSQLYTNYLTLSDAIQLGRVEVRNEAVVRPIEAALKLPEPLMMEFF